MRQTMRQTMRESVLKMLNRLSFWLFWPGMALIAWGELTPRPPEFAQHVWDKAEHFTAYFGLVAMATMVIGLRTRLAWAVLGVWLLGGVLEILQGYTGRDPDIFDFLANSLGAAAGLAVASLFILLLKPRALVGGPAAD